MPARNFMTIGAVIALLALPAEAAAPARTAPAWTVDKSQSRLGFTGTYDGTPFTGQFGAWDARILFDPADLGASMADVTIETGSASTGDPDHDEHLPGPSWFSVKVFPQASFRTESISATGPDAYVAQGALTIRGVTQPVSLPFTLAIAGDIATMSGKLTLDRTAFGLGAGAYGGGDMVAPEVTVNVELTARREG